MGGKRPSCSASAKADISERSWLPPKRTRSISRRPLPAMERADSRFVYNSVANVQCIDSLQPVEQLRRGTGTLYRQSAAQ